MPDLATVAISAGIGAGVSALGVITSQLLQARTQRRIAEDVRAHELRLRRDADARDLRNAKLERLRRGLLVVTRTAMSLLDAVQRLDADPRGQLKAVDAVLKDLSGRLEDIRSELVLDAETDHLLVELFAAIRRYQQIASTWNIQQQAYEATKGAPSAPGRDSVVVLAEKATSESKELQDEIHGVISRARTILAELEKPIG